MVAANGRQRVIFYHKLPDTVAPQPLVATNCKAGPGFEPKTPIPQLPLGYAWSNSDRAHGAIAMKRFLLGTAALLAFAGAANAADLPTKAMPVKAPPPVTYDWTGFYIGGFYGTSVQESKAHTDPPGTASTEPGEVHFSNGGLMFGGTLGYNYQFAPNWLVGVEGEFGTLGISRTFKEWNDAIIAGSKASGYGTLRARVGYVTGPSLLYLTGGAAFVDITDTFGGGGAAAATANTTTKTGYTVGGGIETTLSRNWSATTEFQYINAGSTTFGANVLGVAGTPTTFDHSYYVVKSGLNYKLDGHWDGLPFFGAPMLPSNHPWGGFYAGVNMGGGMSVVRAMDVGVTPGGENDPRGTGFAGGGQIGYNYMLWNNKWFVGAEGDIGYLGIHASVDDWFDTSFARMQANTNWYATARGRFGTSTGPALLYVTAGGAWVHFTDGFAPTTPVTTGDLSSRTGSGWTIGGGTQVALDPHWSARLESLYIDAGHREHQLLPAVYFADFKDRFMVVRAGLDYQFGN